MSGEHNKQGSTRFRPLTDGLGLNHFADGLPYSPTQSKRRTMVGFQYPPPRKPHYPPSTTQTNTVESKAEPQPQVQKDYEYASLFRRIFAFLIDSVIATLVFIGIVFVGLKLNGIAVNLGSLHENARSLIAILLPLALMYVLVFQGYFLVQETAWRSTLGKSFLRLRIQSRTSFSVLARSLCFLAAICPFGLGLLWYFFDSKKRCWHDVITDTEVVRY